MPSLIFAEPLDPLMKSFVPDGLNSLLSCLLQEVTTQPHTSIQLDQSLTTLLLKYITCKMLIIKELMLQPCIRDFNTQDISTHKCTQATEMVDPLSDLSSSTTPMIPSASTIPITLTCLEIPSKFPQFSLKVSMEPTLLISQLENGLTLTEET